MTSRRAAVACGACVSALMLFSANARAQQPPPAYPYGPAPAQQPAYPYGSAPAQPQYGQPPYGQAPYGQAPYGQPYGQTPYGNGANNASSTSSGDDSGRTLELFYARAGLSGALVASQALSKGDLRLKSPTGAGAAIDLGVGIRLLVLTFGPRARMLLLSQGVLTQLGAEVAFRVPLGKLDPFVGVEGGYTFGKRAKDDFDFPCSAPALPCGQSGSDLSVHGVDVGLTGGADYYLSPMFSVGGHASLMLLFLSRDAMPWALATDAAGEGSGSGTGLGAVLGAHVALHL